MLDDICAFMRWEVKHVEVQSMTEQLEEPPRTLAGCERTLGSSTAPHCAHPSAVVLVFSRAVLIRLDSLSSPVAPSQVLNM